MYVATLRSGDESLTDFHHGLLREIQGQILPHVLRRFGVGADAAPYVDLFFQVTTQVELYPETLAVLNALGHIRSAVVSDADHEHLAAWNFTLRR